MTDQTQTPPQRGEIIPNTDGSPLVTMVIAVYNDATHLPAAITSVLTQTLRSVEVLVIDDGSTDPSLSVAERFAQENENVRAFSMGYNSGGAGAPRNVGIDHASGRYVMFLDSDDTLERHACANVVRVADRDEADLVMGRTKRVDVASGKQSGWYARLFTEELTLDSVEEFPDLARDTSVAKACRRTFLTKNNIRFPEDIHYEDLVFTCLVQTAAKRITVIPETIYIWNTYPVSARKSITHSQETLHNLNSRMQAHERIFNHVNSAINPLYMKALHEKLIVHDIRLYITDIAENTDDQFARAALQKLAKLVALVPTAAIQSMEYQRRLSAAAVMAKDPYLVRTAARMLQEGSDLEGRFTQEADQLVWEKERLTAAGAPARAVTLATGHTRNHRSIPWFNVKFAHRLGKMQRETTGDALIITGSTQDPLHQIEQIPGLVAQLRLIERTGLKRQWPFPLKTRWDKEESKYLWTTRVALPKDVDLIDLPRLTLRIDLTAKGVTQTDGIVTNERVSGNKLKIMPTGRLGKIFNAKYQPYKTVANTLALKPSKIGGRRSKLRTVLMPLAFGQNVLYGLKNRPVTGTDKAWFRAIYRLLRMFPKSDRVLVEAQMGKSRSGSPGELARILDARGSSILWGASPTPRPSWAVEDAPVAIRGTWNYILRLATCKYLVDDQSFPDYYVKRRGQTYVQTWHGIPALPR